MNLGSCAWSHQNQDLYHICMSSKPLLLIIMLSKWHLTCFVCYSLWIVKPILQISKMKLVRLHELIQYYKASIRENLTLKKNYFRLQNGQYSTKSSHILSSILPKVNLHNHSVITKTRNYKLYSDFTSVLTNAFLLFHDVRM